MKSNYDFQNILKLWSGFVWFIVCISVSVRSLKYSTAIASDSCAATFGIGDTESEFAAVQIEF